jgi:hypothetical protein
MIHGKLLCQSQPEPYSRVDFIPQSGFKNFALWSLLSMRQTSGARMPRFAGCCLVGTWPVAMTTCTATTWLSASWRSSVSGPSSKIMCALGWRKVRRPFAETSEGEMLVEINEQPKNANILYISFKFLKIFSFFIYCRVQVQLIYCLSETFLFYFSSAISNESGIISSGHVSTDSTFLNFFYS